MEEKNSKLVFDAGTARKLLKAGAHMIDIKPNRSNSVSTVFVFENNDIFNEKLNEILINKNKVEEQNK